MYNNYSFLTLVKISLSKIFICLLQFYVQFSTVHALYCLFGLFIFKRKVFSYFADLRSGLILAVLIHSL